MLFVGDDWGEDHHDIEIVNDQGSPAGAATITQGPEGVARLHALIAAAMPEDWAELQPGEAAARVKVGIETERGPWVAALVAAGYDVFAINPRSVARYRERRFTSGAKSDAGDAPHAPPEGREGARRNHRPHRSPGRGAGAPAARRDRPARCNRSVDLKLNCPVSRTVRASLGEIG